MSGSESTQFRSALHGFNRYDVVNYIESAASAHEHALREKQKELAALHEQNRTLEDENRTLRAEIEAHGSELEALRAEIATLNALCAEQEEALSAKIEQPEASDEPDDAPSEPSISELELAAYRRAEAVERCAASRADQLYASMSEICQSLSGRMQSSETEVSLLYTEFTDCLGRMHEALADVKLVLDQAPEQIAALQSAGGAND